MSKSHLAVFLEAEKPASWNSPQRTTAICGKEIPDAKPIQDFHSLDQLQSRSTLELCRECLLRIGQRKEEKIWLYLINDAKTVDRLNRNEEI